MRAISLRSLHLDGPPEDVVQVIHRKEIVGTFVPVGVADPERAAESFVSKQPPARGLGEILASVGIEQEPCKEITHRWTDPVPAGETVSAGPIRVVDPAAARKARSQAQARVLAKLNGGKG
jgi:hypothetical protein